MRIILSTVILCLCIHVSSYGQRIITIQDSTTLKHYFGRQVQRIYIGPDKKAVEKTETSISINSPLSLDNAQKTNEGLAGGPIINISRNDNTAMLNKRIRATMYNLDLSSFHSLSKISYRAYLGQNSKVDSVVIFFSYRDTIQTTPERYLRKENLIESVDEKVLNGIKQALEEAIDEFSLSYQNMKETHLNGSFSLNFEKKDLNSYLSTLSDTVSTISLADFGLRHFPVQLKRFRNLKNIDLKNNFIDYAEIDKRDFPKLKVISFQQNLLRDKHLIVKGRLKIETLNLNNNHFSEIPKTNKRIKHLFLANNSINEVSKADIRKVKKVESLNLYANKVTSISPRIYKIKKLKEIDLYRNNLNHIPEKITRLKNLESLALSHNNLTNLPTTVSNIKSLKTLYAHHNKLLDLPDLPTNLETLDVGYNRLEKIEEYVKPLISLKTLDYSNNFVKGDLNFLLELPDIKEIYLFENKYASTEQEEKYFSDVFYRLVSKGIKVK
jgi:Leucine-rich repeat (LRR) protein